VMVLLLLTTHWLNTPWHCNIHDHDQGAIVSRALRRLSRRAADDERLAVQGFDAPSVMH
jgi:hypothetical protein